MDKEENNNINGLMLLLSQRKTNGCYFDQRYHAALTALVAERDALRIELGLERMRLEVCGVAAISNTRETAKENREVSDEYKSSSFDEVCAAVDREMALRERVAELEATAFYIPRKQPCADRELRERLVESALRGVNVSGLHRSEAELIGTASVWMVDAAIAAMRKGASDGK